MAAETKDAPQGLAEALDAARPIYERLCQAAHLSKTDSAAAVQALERIQSDLVSGRLQPGGDLNIWLRSVAQTRAAVAGISEPKQ